MAVFFIQSQTWESDSSVQLHQGKIRPETMNTKEKSQDNMKVKAESNPFKKPAPPTGHVTKKAKKQETSSMAVSNMARFRSNVLVHILFYSQGVRGRFNIN